ncbi:Crm-domain containing factor cfm2 protein [Thalictrum thalictroides]|uniref:Crm-domain containing factor cfm2 protein n=1 Tax=Thalictrum thalictroides TaxID=46969 RepID=A0A7J6VDK3_THATH|nr:Crm-domain containing factor cfm2 protein [Thalictrum thalictroides]
MAHILSKRLQSIYKIFPIFIPKHLHRISQWDPLVQAFCAFHTSSILPFLQDSSSSSVATPLCYTLERYNSFYWKQKDVRFMSNTSVSLKVDSDVIRFSFDKSSPDRGRAQTQLSGQKTFKKVKKSRKAKVNELKLYRLLAKKKMTHSNPEVRIRYKLEKAKRKEMWLIEKLRKFEVPKPLAETYDPEILTEEEKFYLKRTGEKKKNYVPVGRRGVFGGVVLNMHLHWKNNETVKVICKPCKPGQVYEYAEELVRLSKGIVIDIRANNTIIFYRGKNYVRPEVMSPTDTLSKSKALEKYKYEQSLEHTSQFIEKLEKELEEFHKHIERYRKNKEAVANSSVG